MSTDYTSGQPPEWDRHSIHIIEELRRLSRKIEDLTDKMEEQQNEFHAHRMESLKEVAIIKAEHAKEITALNTAFVEFKTEIKTKFGFIAAGVALIINLAFGYFTNDAPTKQETTAAKPKVEHIKNR